MEKKMGGGYQYSKMKEVIILVGEGRAGKTTYAKKFAKANNYEYLTIDGMYDYSGPEKYFKFVDAIVYILNLNSHKNFILDGYLDYDDHFNYMKPRLFHHKITPILIFDNHETIRSRGKGGGLRIRTSEEIINAYKGFKDKWNFEKYLEGIGENREVKTYDEVMEIVEGKSNLSEQKVIDFLNRFYARKPELYHTIELPYGHKIQGYTENAEHKSWEKISKVYNFKDKRVADMGCFQGYFCFEIAKNAKEVHGYDKNELALEIAREIAELKEQNIEFRKFDLNHDDIKEYYDTILLLNTLHHLKNPQRALEQIFKHGTSVILEVQFAGFSPQIQTGWKNMQDNTKGWDKERLKELAKLFGHELKQDFISPRGREILIFEKISEQNVIDFVSSFKFRGITKYFYEIELPYGYKIYGEPPRKEVEDVWKTISNIYDFIDKKVADVGCFMGYHCFKIREMTDRVYGFDNCLAALETGRTIASLKRKPITFIPYDFNKDTLTGYYDAIICLHSLQYCTDTKKVMLDILKRCNTFIFEQPMIKNQPHWCGIIPRDELIRIGESLGHKLVKEIPSPRGVAGMPKQEGEVMIYMFQK